MKVDSESEVAQSCPTLSAGSDTVEFQNKYEDETQIRLAGTKVLTGRDMKANEFSFAVMEGDKKVATGTNAGAKDGASGIILFTTIPYDQDDIGPHTYTITEDAVAGYITEVSGYNVDLKTKK